MASSLDYITDLLLYSRPTNKSFSYTLIYARYYLAAYYAYSVDTDVAHSHVAWSVCLSVCVLVTLTYCAKMAQLIEMWFGWLISVYVQKPVLDGVKLFVFFSFYLHFPFFWYRTLDYAGSSSAFART